MTTSLFGRKKFGSFKFGPTTLTQPRYGLEVDWDGDGFFDGINEGPNLQDLTIDRGRKYTISSDGNSFESEETGRFTAKLLDPDRRYDPFNTSSPLYGLLQGGRYFRVYARSTSNVKYPLMSGILDEPISFRERGMPMARLSGQDGWGFLRDGLAEVYIPLQETIYSDAAILQILNAASWPSIWGSVLAAGVDARPYFWAEGVSAAETIHSLAHSELGVVFIDANGAMNFRPRTTLENSLLALTDNDVVGVQRQAPKEVIRNIIRVTTAPRSEQALQVVWGIPSRLQVNAGETISDIFAEFEFNGETVPVKNPIAPVAVTDYNATANDDGTGTDYTGNISISMYPFATRAQLSITNNGANTAYVYVQIRGIPLAYVGSVSFDARSEDSIRQFGPRPFNFSIDQNLNVARQYRDILEMFFSLAKNYLIVDLMPNPDLQFSLDLGDVIQAVFNNYGVNANYRVIRISHRFSDVNGIVVNTRLWLEPYTRLWTGIQIPFQIPAQIGSIP